MGRNIDKLKKYFLYPYRKRSLELKNKSKHLLFVNLICSGFLIIFFLVHLFVEEKNFIILGQLFGISLLSFSFYFLRNKKLTLAGNFTTFSIIAFSFFSFIINDVYVESVSYLRIYETLSVILLGLILLSLYAISKKQIFLFSVLAFFILAVDFSVISTKLNALPTLSTWISLAVCLFIFIVCASLTVLILNKYKELIKVAERESFKSRLKYKSLYKNIDDGFLQAKLVYNKQNEAVDAILTEVNDVFEKLCGYKRYDIINKKLSKTYAEIKAYFDNWEEALVLINKEGQLKYNIYNKYNKHWMKVRAFSSEEGYFVMLFDDISDIFEKNESLIKTNEKHNLIINNITEGIIVFDEEKILETNSIIDKLLGFNKLQLLEKSMIDIVDKDQYDNFFIISDNNKSNHFKTVLNTKDGIGISVDMTLKLISDNSKKIFLAVVNVIEIVESTPKSSNS